MTNIGIDDRSAKQKIALLPFLHMETFGERLKFVAQTRFGGVAKLAELAGIDATQMSKYCSGTNEPKRPILERLAELFDEEGVSVVWLLTGRGPMDAPEFPEAHGTLQPRRIYVEIDGKLVPYDAAPPDRDEDQEHNEEED